MTMRITYDPDADALYVELRRPAQPGGYGEDVGPGAILHYDAEGNVVALEILDARERLGGKPLATITLEHFPYAPPKPVRGKRIRAPLLQKPDTSG